MSFPVNNQLATSGLGTDTLLGVADVSLVGGAGDNSIDASGSSGAFDSKVLDGGAGADTLTGGGDPETLLGGTGTDSVPSTGNFADLVDGGGDADTLLPDAQDSVLGAGGNDHVITTFGPASVEGGTGTDRVINVDGGDQALSDAELVAGTDTIPLDSIEEASLSGNSVANEIDADGFSGGPVTLFGDGGFDTLTGTAAGDLLDGGTGAADQLIQQANSDIDLDDTLVVGDGTDTLAGIELASLTGTAAG